MATNRAARTLYRGLLAASKRLDAIAGAEPTVAQRLLGVFPSARALLQPAELNSHNTPGSPRATTVAMLRNAKDTILSSGLPTSRQFDLGLYALSQMNKYAFTLEQLAEEASEHEDAAGSAAHSIGAVVRVPGCNHPAAVIGRHSRFCGSPEYAAASGVSHTPRGMRQPFYILLLDLRDDPSGMLHYVCEDLLTETTSASAASNLVLHPALATYFSALDLHSGKYVGASQNLQLLYPLDCGVTLADTLRAGAQTLLRGSGAAPQHLPGATTSSPRQLLNLAHMHAALQAAGLYAADTSNEETGDAAAASGAV